MSALRVVIFREGDAWLAQGLEHDVGVQGEHLKDLVARLRLLLDTPGLDRPLAALDPAPQYFQDLWKHRAGLFEPPDDGVAPDAPSRACVFGLVC